MYCGKKKLNIGAKAKEGQEKSNGGNIGVIDLVMNELIKMPKLYSNKDILMGRSYVIQTNSNKDS